jgi:Fe-Mn family superoxide dismutase
MTDLLSFLSRDPSLSLAFNYASLLLNTSFFLEGLVKDPAGAGKQQVPAGYAGLEEQLVAQARGMVGSGWLWVSLFFPAPPDLDRTYDLFARRTYY